MSRCLAIITVLIAVAGTAQQSTPPPATPPDTKSAASANATSPMLLKLMQFTMQGRGNSYVYNEDPNYPEGRTVTDSSTVSEHSTVRIGQDSSVTWEIDNLEDNHVGSARNGYRCSTRRSYKGVLSAVQMQQLKSIIDNDTFTQLNRPNLNLEGSAAGSTQGVLFISRGDHIQALAFGSGHRSKAAKRAPDAKEQEKIDNDIQDALHWIEDQIQKPHKKELREDWNKCTPSN